MKKMFVYGSLKKGFFNHFRFGFGDKAVFLGTSIAHDVSLVALNPHYPHAFVNKGGIVRGEVYELDDKEIEDSIEWMEQGAGYTQHKVVLDEGEGEAVMYVADTNTARYIDEAITERNLPLLEEWKEAA
jgi:gamma-glutamylcyclotransferase (GGCT)/AIG2-like uncharacterized protein YtfP